MYIRVFVLGDSGARPLRFRISVARLIFGLRRKYFPSPYSFPIAVRAPLCCERAPKQFVVSAEKPEPAVHFNPVNFSDSSVVPRHASSFYGGEQYQTPKCPKNHRDKGKIKSYPTPIDIRVNHHSTPSTCVIDPQFAHST